MTSTPTDPERTPLESPPKKAWRWRGGLQAAYATLTGISHVQNEDSCRHMPSADKPMFCAVADGVGGGAYGNIASNALVDHCAQATLPIASDDDSLVKWLRAGDAVVRDAVARHSTKAGASTLVAAWFLSSSRVHLVNIGDCRAYLLRPQWGGYAIAQLTVDQTYGNLGLTPPAHAGPDDPARMAGVGAVGSPPVVKVSLEQNDLLLLCSDGLHKFVSDELLAEICWQGTQNKESLESLCQSLVKKAKEQASHDDISALLVMRHRWFGLGRAYWMALGAALLAAGTYKVWPSVVLIETAAKAIYAWIAI